MKGMAHVVVGALPPMTRNPMIAEGDFEAHDLHPRHAAAQPGNVVMYWRFARWAGCRSHTPRWNADRPIVLID